MNKFSRTWLCVALMNIALVLATQAQTTATWSNPAGGEWNTAGNWDLGVPGVTTNAALTNIVAAYTVNYLNPMTAGNIAGLTLTNSTSVTLNINNAGFNVAGTTVARNGGRIVVGNGGVMTNNLLQLVNNGFAVIGTGAIVTNTTLGVGNSVGAGAVTNAGGLLVSTTTAIGNSSDGGVLIINGGTSLLGNFSIARCGGGALTPPGAFSSGLVINGGAVYMTSCILGSANSWGNLGITAGVLTNTGDFIVARQATGKRGGQFTQTGGLVVSTTNSGVRLVVPGTTTTNQVANYAVTGGTNIVEGFQIGDATIAAPVGVNGTVNFTNAATIVVGAAGIYTNSGNMTLNFALNNGGRFAAKADWLATVPFNLSSGTFNFGAADLDGTPHNITLSNSISGTGALNKTGGGTLTLNAPNTYSGSTTISAGTLALGIGVSGLVGSISGTLITVSSNATLDVTGLAANGGFVLAATKTLAGVGTVTGTFTAGANANLSPAGVGAQGTLNFASGLVATNANLNIELTDDPSGLIKTNDFINITGDLTVVGTNNIIVTPVGSLGAGTYKLIKYSGNLNGSITNFACVTGTLTNVPGGINLVVTSVRPTAGLIWKGDGSANLWDTGGSSNWLNGASLDRFYTGDTNIFGDATTNFIVNLSGILTPASSTVVLVNATSDYVFSGSGDINGATGLTKTNSGKLTILTANDYTGITTISGGTISVTNLSNGGLSSPIGAAANGSANLVLNGGTLEYLGANQTVDRGATIQSSGGIFSVTNSATTLTLSGILTGPGGLTKIGNGQITLGGANNYNGITTITAGTIRANPASGIGTNILVLNGSTSPATFVFSGDSQTAGTIQVLGTNNFLKNSGNETVGILTGNGLVNLEGSTGNLLTLAAIDSSAFNGTFFMDTLATVRFFPSSGSFLNASNATFDLGIGSGVLNNRNGGTYIIGALAGGASTQLRGSANSGSAGTTYTIGGKNVNSTFAGTILVGAGGSGALVNIIKVGSGVFTLTGNNTYSGSTTVSNGTMALAFNGASDGSIANSTNITIYAGAFLDVSGRSDFTLPLGASQTLRGTGTVLGSIDSSSGGTVSPGIASLGTLTVTNVATLTGTALMDINRAASPNSDKVSAATVNLGGNLVVNNVGGKLQAGDTFTLFTGTLSGAFSTLTLPNYYTWNTSQLSVNGTISVTAVSPPPAISTVDFSTLSTGTITLNATNGAIGGTVVVLTSTNVALPLSNWTSVTTNSFDGSGNLTGVSITADPNAPQSFYLLRAY